jgi:DNA modification methylase
LTGSEYIVGDSRQIVTLLAHVDQRPRAIITSPPYFDIKNYGHTDNQIGIGQTYPSYINDVAKILQNCYELSARNASLWLIVDTIRKGGLTHTIPFDVAAAFSEMNDKSWELRDVVIWNKVKGVPWNTKSNFKNMFEYILFFSKTRKYKFRTELVRDILDLKKWWLTYPERYNPKGKAPTNIWEFAIPMRGWPNGCQNHLCPFPFSLVERILSISTDAGDTVLDPFAGSGSVLAVAKSMNRKAIGIDINREYKRRYQEEVLPGAIKYWERRKKELASMKDRLKDFRIINNRLRKLKMAVKIISELQKAELVFDDSLLVVLEAPKMESETKLLIVRNGISERISCNLAEFRSTVLTDLETEFGISVKLKEMNYTAFRSMHPVPRLHKYEVKRFHRCVSDETVETAIQATGKSDLFFTNISLNISKAEDILKKDLGTLYSKGP